MRPLSCRLDTPTSVKSMTPVYESDGAFKFYDCEVLPLFTLGSCHHQNYLVNIRIPRDSENKINHEIGVLQDVWMVEIHQNGGFTMVSYGIYYLLFTFCNKVVIKSQVFASSEAYSHSSICVAYLTPWLSSAPKL